LQIIERIKKLKEEMGKTPTLNDLSKRYGLGIMPLIHSRYGSYLKLLKDMGMEPNFSNYYPKYSRQYFLEKALSNEPSLRIFIITEGRNLYKYFKGGIPELKREVLLIHNSK
jgi:hypothetical protein